MQSTKIIHIFVIKFLYSLIISTNVSILCVLYFSLCALKSQMKCTAIKQNCYNTEDERGINPLWCCAVNGLFQRTSHSHAVEGNYSINIIYVHSYVLISNNKACN